MAVADRPGEALYLYCGKVVLKVLGGDSVEVKALVEERVFHVGEGFALLFLCLLRVCVHESHFEETLIVHRQFTFERRIYVSTCKKKHYTCREYKSSCHNIILTE